MSWFTRRSHHANDQVIVAAYGRPVVRKELFPPAPLDTGLGIPERMVLEALLDAGGRVLGRVELARRAGLRKHSPRRVDSVLVALRRRLGPDAIVTVRRRGWRLDATALQPARLLLDHAR